MRIGKHSQVKFNPTGHPAWPDTDARRCVLRFECCKYSQHLVTELLQSDRADGEEWTVTSDILEDVNRTATAAGIPALFVLIPERYQIDEALFVWHVQAFKIDLNDIDIDQPNRLLAEELRRRGLRVVDALAPLRAAHRAGKQLHGTVDPHFTPEGHAALFDIVAPVLDSIIR